MINIQAIEYYLPKKIVTNGDLLAQNPAWDIKLLEERAGVRKRHIAAENETALDLAFKASKKLFSKNKGLQRKIDGLIFCTESQDYILPPNSCILHSLLDLSEDALAFDINLACSGYVYGLALAEGMICSGRAKNILLVNADTYSKYINKNDRSIRVLFGDGAAVSLIKSSGKGPGLIDIKCSTSGKHHGKFIIPAGGCRMPVSKLNDKSIRMDGLGILSFVNSKVPKQVLEILKKNKLSIESIDLFIFHQASQMALDSLQRLLKIKPEKMFNNLKEVGNTVSASIPIALKDAMVQGRIKKRDKVLISGFGVGLSWGSAIIQM